MRPLRMVKALLDRMLEGLVVVVVAVLVLDVLWQVFTRFALEDPSTWTEELAIFLLIWVSLLGSAVALGRGAHLGIDYFVGRLAPRTRLCTEVFAFSSIALFCIAVMIVGGIDLVAVTLDLGQRSPALGIRVGFVYLAIPISGFFLSLYALLGLYERIAAMRRASGDDLSGGRP